MQRRSTKQRDIVAATLRELYHPTADEVYERIRLTHPTLGRATVFRNLTVLAEEGRVTRLELPGGATRYDPITDGHTHFVCKSCGRILDLPPMHDFPLPQGEHYVIEQCTVTYTGFCRVCQ